MAYTDTPDIITSQILITFKGKLLVLESNNYNVEQFYSRNRFINRPSKITK